MKRFRTAFFGVLFALLTAAAFAADYLQPEPGAPPQTEPDNGASSIILFFENGLWGAKSSGGRVLVEPEWYRLQIMHGNLLLAQKNNKEHSCGLITADGEQLTPFLYHSMEEIMPDVWKATLNGDGDKVHLYHGDGTRWAERAWDSCSAKDGLLWLTDKKTSVAVSPEGKNLRLVSYHADHAVGVHKLTADLSEAELSAISDPALLAALGEAAADYLAYLFITPDSPPDLSAFSNGDSSARNSAELYRGCSYESGSIAKVFLQEQNGYPAYQLHLVVRCARQDGSRQKYNTAMQLTLTRNSAGSYLFSAFEDVGYQMMIQNTNNSNQ